MPGPGARAMAALAEYCGDLTTAGIPADTDRTRVQVPGAWVSLQNLDITRLDGGGTARVHVHLVVPDNGDTAAQPALAALFDRFTAAGHTWADGEPVDTAWAAVVGPTTSPVPAWRVPVDLDF